MSSRNKWQKVFDNRRRRIRGLWLRNGVYYAQLRLDDERVARRVPLHKAETIAQATAAMQGLKTKRTEGSLQIAKVRGVPTLKEAGETYLNNLKAVGNKSESTQDLHGHCLDRWNEFSGNTPITKIDAGFVHRFAEWRKPQKVSGRTIDIEVTA